MASLAAAAPFHLEATVRLLQRRPHNLVDVWEDGRYRRVLRVDDALVLVDVENRGSVDAPSLALTVHGTSSPHVRRVAARTLRAVLGLDVDPAGLPQLAVDEPRLLPVARALRGVRPPRFPGLFEAFANVVPFQQVSLDAGVAIVRRLVERFGAALEHDGRRYAFPEAAVVAGARLPSLKACGLSARKAEALRKLARAVDDGDVSEAKLAMLPSPDALRFLVELDGIGPWSAALFLLRGLGRLDVFPPGDVGIARGLGVLAGGERALERLVARSGDRKGWLYFCALGNALLARGLIHPAPAG